MLQLKAVTAADPMALGRVLQYLQASNVVPLRVSAVRSSVRGGSKSVLEIEIDVAASDLAPEGFRLVLAKINQLPLVLTMTSN